MGSHNKKDAVATENTENEDVSLPFIKGITPSSPPSTWALGVADRALRTVIQAAVGYLTAVQLVTPGHIDFGQFGGIVGGAALISIATSLISAPSFANSWWYQVIERAVKTFCQVFISAIVTTSVAGATFSVLPSGMTEVVSAAGIAALTSALTSILAMSVGEPTAVDLIIPFSEETIDTDSQKKS